jgi:hypothetical protein
MAFDWMTTFAEWREEGFSPDNIKVAVGMIVSEGRAGSISRPASITHKLRGAKVLDATREVIPVYYD